MWDDADFNPVTKLVSFLVIGVAMVWLTWCTVVAFTGGTLPLIGWQVEGGLGFGLLWVFVIDPIAVTVAFWVSFLISLPFMAVSEGVSAVVRRARSDPSSATTAGGDTQGGQLADVFENLPAKEGDDPGKGGTLRGNPSSRPVLATAEAVEETMLIADSYLVDDEPELVSLAAAFGYMSDAYGDSVDLRMIARVLTQKGVLVGLTSEAIARLDSAEGADPEQVVLGAEKAMLGAWSTEAGPYGN